MENSQENTTFILADVKVFDFLKEKAGDRKTKTEAYWDLLDRSMAGFVSPFVRKVERKLLPNQCHVTISDLAEFWHWHRATVRTFLDALESFGLLERTKLNKSVIITMTVQSGKNAIAGTEQEEPDFATRIGSILSEWVIGKKTSEDAGHSCGQALCQALAAIAGKDNSQASGNGTDTVSAEVVRQEEKLRETILECIANAALQRVLRKSRFDNISQLSQFFTLDLGGEWGAFIETAKELAELVFNPETSGAGVDMDRNKELLKSFRIPFLSLAAKAQTLSD